MTAESRVPTASEVAALLARLEPCCGPDFPLCHPCEMHYALRALQLALEQAQGEVDRLRTALSIQAAAVRLGMDSAKAVSSEQLRRAARLHAESNPGALNSERDANAILTEERDKLASENGRLRAFAQEVHAALRAGRKETTLRGGVAVWIDTILTVHGLVRSGQPTALLTGKNDG